MTTLNPITPPPGLVEKWFNDSPLDRGLTLATRAAQWGADQELEACCKELEYNFMPDSSSLRAARRPKPPSLKKQALEELAEWENVMDIAPDSPIRRALEALDD
jgi:hypothetical protein